MSISNLDENLTVVMTVSPVRSHASTKMVSEAVASLREGLGLEFKLIFACDAPEPGCDPRLVDRYVEHKQRLAKEFDATVFEADEWLHHALTLKRGIDLVETEFLLATVHDFTLARPVDGPGILKELATWPAVKFIRLNQRANLPIGWDFRMEQAWGKHVPLVRTCAWCGDPHFALTEIWKATISDLCVPGKFIEGCVMDAPGNGWMMLARDGMRHFQGYWGACIYGSLGDPAATHHLDGRTYSAAKEARP